jgi:hypothetical protein
MPLVSYQNSADKIRFTITIKNINNKINQNDKNAEKYQVIKGPSPRFFAGDSKKVYLTNPRPQQQNNTKPDRIANRKNNPFFS